MNYAVIAAGEGSRLVEEGIKLPKPLVELAGTPLIKRLIDIFIRNNAESISIIVNEEMTSVQEYINRINIPVPLHLVIKSTPGSMHSFFELSPYLKKGKFCLTTVDTIFREKDFSNFIRCFENNSTDEGMMAVTDFVDDEKPLYVSVDEATMTINGFFDTTDGSYKYISGGIYCLTPKAIDTLNSCMKEGIVRMRNYQRKLISDNLKLKAYPFNKIIDVDHAEDILKAEQFLNDK